MSIEIKTVLEFIATYEFEEPQPQIILPEPLRETIESGEKAMQAIKEAAEKKSQPSESYKKLKEENAEYEVDFKKIVEASEKIKQKNYKISDIDKITRSNEQDLGYLISALLHDLKKEDKITINLKKPIDNLCCMLKEGKVIIKGNTGKYLGKYMIGGEIETDYNTGSFLGYGMTNGKITVRNADAFAGQKMEGGIITVKRHAGDFSGNEMKGGELIIHKTAGDYLGSKMENGKITMHGKTGNFAGQYMKGGLIDLLSDAGISLGSCMEGGKIILRRNAGINAGQGMKGGTIEIWGEAKSIFVDKNKGEIYYKGKRIYEDPHYTRLNNALRGLRGE